MSKMDDLRAMREARYAKAAARGAQPAAPAKHPVAPAVPRVTEPVAAEALCGHQNIGGRTCTRERGHAAKSHRYS